MARTPTKKGKGKDGNGGGKKIPESPLKKGEFASKMFVASANKAARHEIDYMRVQMGVCGGWLKKANEDRQPFMLHDYQLFKNDGSVREKLKIGMLTSRRGGDGKPRKCEPGSKHEWNLYPMFLGEDGNTAAGARAAVNDLKKHLNANATSDNYTWPRKYTIGKDHTGNKLRPVDALLLDSDVFALMQAAYPQSDMVDLMEDKEVMSKFWTNVEHGKKVLRSQIEGLSSDSDSDSEEDSEEEKKPAARKRAVLEDSSSSSSSDSDSD